MRQFYNVDISGCMGGSFKSCRGHQLLHGWHHRPFIWRTYGSQSTFTETRELLSCQLCRHRKHLNLPQWYPVSWCIFVVIGTGGCHTNFQFPPVATKLAPGQLSSFINVLPQSLISSLGLLITIKATHHIHLHTHTHTPGQLSSFINVLPQSLISSLGLITIKATHHIHLHTHTPGQLSSFINILPQSLISSLGLLITIKATHQIHLHTHTHTHTGTTLEFHKYIAPIVDFLARVVNHD